MSFQTIQSIIEKKFHEDAGDKGSVTIPLKKGDGRIIVKLSHDGVLVSNLGHQPMLPWGIFEGTVALVQRNGGKCPKGDAINGKLGDSRLPIDSIEGYIAYKFYEKTLGETVFRRITPVGCILEWAGVCENERGELVLKGKYKEEAPEAKPAAAPVSTPLSKPVSKYVSKPVSKPLSKPVSTPATMPVAKPVVSASASAPRKNNTPPKVSEPASARKAPTARPSPRASVRPEK